MESRKYPTFQLPPGELNCSKTSHGAKPYEFVCTKRDCENRLACAQCLLEDHSAHFQWMVVIEEYFSSKENSVPDNLGQHMQGFIQDRQGLIDKFEKSLIKESEKVKTNLGQFKEKWLEKFNDIEQRVTEKTENYKQGFADNIQVIQNYTSSSERASIPNVIKDTQTLQEYLDQEISKKNDLREKKFERIFEEIKDHLDALSLMDFEKRKTDDILSSMDSILDFTPKTDALEFYKKAALIPTSTLNYNDIVCKRTIQTTHKKAVYKVLPIDNESKVATCSDDHTIMIYDLKNGEASNTLLGHTDRIWSIIKLRNGNLASCSSDNTIRIWNPHKGICERTLNGHTGPIRCLVEFPNLALLSGSHDKTLKFWDLKSDSKECVKTLKSDNMGRITVCILVSIEDIAFGSETNVRVMNFNTGATKQTLRGHKSIVRDLLLLANEKYDTLLSASEDKTIMMWNIIDGTCLKTFNGHSRSVNRILMFNPETIVSASDDGTIKFWSLETATCTKTLSGHEGWISYFTILTNGMLLSCGDDKTIKFWGTE